MHEQVLHDESVCDSIKNPEQDEGKKPQPTVLEYGCAKSALPKSLQAQWKLFGKEECR